MSAWLFAERLHRGQLRRYTQRPYVSHPFAVCHLLRRLDAPRELQIAALLHDVIEQTDASLLQIADRFSPAVASLVMECSRVTTSADGPRSRRHTVELAHMARMTPQAQSVKLADIIHNAHSLVRRDPRFADVYIAEKTAEIATLSCPSIPALNTLATRVVARARKQLDAHTAPAAPTRPLIAPIGYPLVTGAPSARSLPTADLQA